jgi:hypothetical protein
MQALYVRWNWYSTGALLREGRGILGEDEDSKEMKNL